MRQEPIVGIDYVYTLLTWSGQWSYRSEVTDKYAHVNNAKQFLDKLHRDYPLVKVMGVQLPSLNGGLGSNYGASGTYSDTYGMVRTIFGLNLAYQAMCNEVGYSDFCEFVNVSSQFDSENNMPESDAYVNTRSATTEKLGTNVVHPKPEGYLQNGEVAYRSLSSEL